MFGRHTDYHGTRSYAADKASPPRSSEVGLRTSLAFAWIRLQIEKLFRAGPPSSTTAWLMRGDRKSFTKLGSRPPKEEAISDMFPIANSEARKRR